MTPTVDWTALATGAGMAVAAHPFSYVKVLVQLGHEPLQPVIKKDMFFRKRLLYPGVFEYMSHIKSIHGFVGLYTGVVPRVFANATMTITYGAVKQVLSPEEDESASNQEEEQDFRTVFIHLSKETASRCSAVVLSQPFHVIAIRTMASFIGQEARYSTVIGCIQETYQEEGILGFFAGLLPRLALETACLWASELLAYAINTYVISEKGELRDMRHYTPMVTSYVSQGFCYPLSVTTTVMACNGSSLLAGRPPFIPIYPNWTSCLSDLRRKGVEKRGSSMLFRQAMVPRHISINESLFEDKPSPFIKDVLHVSDAPAEAAI